MPSCGPQVNYFPSFQTLSTIKHADSSAEFVRSKRRTGRREARGRELVNKVKKNSLYKSLSVHPWKL
jgi:hypothetical protein